MRRVWVGLAMAIGLASITAGGIVINNGGGAPAGTANLWVDTNGGTCTRSASPASYSDAAACTSLDAAYDAASCADTVLIKAGSYGNQTITGDRTCGSGSYTIAAARGVTMTGGVLMSVADSESVTFSEIEFQSDWVEVRKANGTALNVDGVLFEKAATSTTNIILRDAEVTNAMWVNVSAASGLVANNVALVGGGLSWSGSGAEPVYLQTCDGCSGDTLGTNVVIDGVNFHDIFQPNTADPHIEVIRIDRGYNGVKFRNNSLYDNINVTTSVFFIGNVITSGSGSINPTNIVVENNYFGTWGNCCGPNGAAFVTLNGGGSSSCDVITFRYNTFLGPLGTIGCATTSYIGNLGPKGVGCSGTFTKNVWQHSANSACGTDTWQTGTADSTSALGLGGTNGFDLQAGSVAIGAAETANCPATDHDGNPRPNGGGNCDAGADER